MNRYDRERESEKEREEREKMVKMPSRCGGI